MNSKERYDYYSKIGIEKRTPEQKVMDLVNRLIEALYIPVDGFDSITKTDYLRLEHFGIDENEPINWGDLKCQEVNKIESGFEVIIDEAAPGDCQTFCDYIERMMKSYGWDCKVQTEW